MNVENQVCTLKQAERLKEIGIIQASLFTWCVYCPDPIGEKYYYYCFYKDDNSPNAEFSELIASAFNESELAVMLDAFYETYRTHKNKWSCGQVFTDIKEFNTPCEASADRLIYLLEKDERVTATSCNERLIAFLKHSQ